jgi:hypothetical protein
VLDQDVDQNVPTPSRAVQPTQRGAEDRVRFDLLVQQPFGNCRAEAVGNPFALVKRAIFSQSVVRASTVAFTYPQPANRSKTALLE